MDINGAKALKERLSLNGKGEAGAAPVEVEIAEGAPPVYHWTGVSQSTPEAPAGEEEEPTPTSLFRRMGLSFR